MIYAPDEVTSEIALDLVSLALNAAVTENLGGLRLEPHGPRVFFITYVKVDS